MANAGGLWLNMSYLRLDESFGGHEEINGRQKVLVSDSGGKMTAYEGVCWQNKGYCNWGLNLVHLLLDASYMEPDEGKRRVSLAWAYGSEN